MSFSVHVGAYMCTTYTQVLVEDRKNIRYHGQVLCAIVSHPRNCLGMDLVPTRKQHVFLIAETLDF